MVQAGQLKTLADQGFEYHGRKVAGGVEVDLVMTQDQRDKLAQDGIDAELTRVKGGLTVQQFAAKQALAGFTVWRSWDEAGGIRDEMKQIARDNRHITKLVSLGRTLQGREILALKVTDDARDVRDGKRPAVLFSSTQHAREWIATEVNRRVMLSYINGWNHGNQKTRKLLRENELWFVLVANPDGYQYTFDHERLWRKNLRDNNGDGVTQVGDGVDPNRNWPNHFKYDNEGSSGITSSDTYAAAARSRRPRRRR